MMNMNKNFKLKFRGPTPKQALAKIKKTLKLPRQFCGVCSLTEGTVVVVIISLFISIALITLCLLALLPFKQKLNEMWEVKLQKDFHSSFASHEMDKIYYAKYYKNAWMYVLWTAVGICSSYIFTAFGVIYALIRKKANPGWNIPWLVFTFILLVISVALAITLTAFAKIFSGGRDILITTDIMPVTGILVLVCFWTYGFCVVLAHCKKQFRIQQLAEKRAMEAKIERLVRRKKHIIEEMITGTEDKTPVN